MNAVTGDIESFMENLRDNMKYMEDHVEYLLLKDQKFAKSLIEYYDIYGNLSDKQAYYAHKMWKDIKLERRD